MTTNNDQILELSALAAIEAMREGDMTAEDYAACLLARAEAQGSLNAFRTLDRSLVIEAARKADLRRAANAPLGLLHGLPIPVKDSVNTRALPTSNGTRALENFRPREDAAVLKGLFAEGALLMGKTNLHELSFGWTSNNLSFGPVRNPYDPERIPGGSSGGSAAAVAARMAPLAVAEDTHGSIRVPATMCGLAGLRPTYGRYPDEGILPLTKDKFDQVGPLARTVADLALFDAALTHDQRPVLPQPLAGVRLGIAPAFFFEGLDPEVECLLTNTLERLAAAGAVIVKAEVPEIIRQGPTIALTIQFFEMLSCLSGFLAGQGAAADAQSVLSQVAPNTDFVLQTLVLPPNGVPAEAYQDALRMREELKAAIYGYFADNRIEALLFPPVLCPAPPLGDNVEIDIAGRKESLVTVFGRNTALSPCAGMPGLVLPAGMTAGGLPVGIELEALPHHDRSLLSLGLAVEKVLGRIPAPGIR